MLMQEENVLLTQVGPGTPGGELMRRYWHPVLPTQQLDEDPVQAIRILSEDLVLFRDRRGNMGLVGKRCPHRMMDLRFGIPEDEGLRCPYHGWVYDNTGQCIEQPAEPEGSTYYQKIRTTAYPVHEVCGLIFAYTGPGERPRPSVATALNNLASLLQETNRREEAGPLMRRAFCS